MCLLTNERYKTYQTRFSFGHLGHAPGVGLWGTGGSIFFPKFNQIWCVRYLHEWHMQWHNILGPRPLGPLGGAKWSIIKSQLQSQFQRYLKQTLCVFSQMNDINILDVIFIQSPGSCPRVWDLGVLGGKKKSFSEHGHVAYQIKGDEQ